MADLNMRSWSQMGLVCTGRRLEHGSLAIQTLPMKQRTIALSGATTDVPVIGDWDGDSVDEIGLFRPSKRTWYFDYSNTPDGTEDYRVTWG